MLIFVSLLVCAGLTFLLGLVVFMSNRKNLPNKVFSLLALSGASWVVLNLLADSAATSVSGLFWTRLTVIPGVGNVYLFWLLSKVFPTNKLRASSLVLFSVPFL